MGSGRPFPGQRWQPNCRRIASISTGTHQSSLLADRTTLGEGPAKEKRANLIHVKRRDPVRLRRGTEDGQLRKNGTANYRFVWSAPSARLACSMASRTTFRSWNQ